MQRSHAVRGVVADVGGRPSPRCDRQQARQRRGLAAVPHPHPPRRQGPEGEEPRRLETTGLPGLFAAPGRESRRVIDPLRRSAPAMIGGLPGQEDAWVLVEPAVFDRVNPFRQRESAASEAGGILLGYRRGAHLYVVVATAPGHEDHGTRVSFRRSANGDREQALSGWYRSDHALDYLGEWHTHPEQTPNPSGTDHRAWRELLAAHPGRPLIFMIMGIDDGIWLGYGYGDNLCALSLEPESL